MPASELCPPSAPFFGFMGAAVALIFASAFRPPAHELSRGLSRDPRARAWAKRALAPSRTHARALTPSRAPPTPSHAKVAPSAKLARV